MIYKLSSSTSITSYNYSKMFLLKSLRYKPKQINYFNKFFSQEVANLNSKRFETVYTFSSIKYIAIINRLKVYHIAGTCIAIPSSGVLEMASLLPQNTFLTTSYIGLTAAAVLCLATLPFRNIIGFLYVSEDNKHVKISSVDFWGKRIDRIIPTDDWVPLLDMPTKTLDPLYLSPNLADGSKYKLLVRFGKIINSKKFGQVIE